MRRALAAVTASAIVVLSACSSSHHSSAASQQPVVVGSANSPENEILANVYADALRNLFPEYNGALLDFLNANAIQSSTADVDGALAKALPSSLEALKPAPGQDSDSVTVTQAFATAHNLKSIADLAPIQNQVTIGAASEFQNREVGLLGLKKLYGLTLKFEALDEAGPLTIAALKEGTVQAADIYTTDPAVAKDHFVALSDPKHLFAAQNVIPIVNRSVATATVVDTLNAVSAKLTTDTLIQMVNAVVNNHVDAATVASQFVAQAKLG